MADDGGTLHGTRFRFGLIGRFSVRQDGRELTDAAIGSRKGRTLLKLLLVNRGHVVSAERIAEALWGEAAPPRADENVASLVSRLRGKFGSQAIQGGRSGYAFAPGPWAETDLDEAQRLVAEAEARLGAGEPSLASSAAERALDLLGPGRLFEEEAYPSWADEPQAWVDRLVRQARRSAWTAALQLSDPRSAIRAAESAISSSPLDEEAYRALLQAHIQTGERGAALEVYERVRSVLADELGVDPSPETQALYLAIVRDQPLPGVTVAAPAFVSATVEPGFVGREEELAVISNRWAGAAAGRPSLLILTGEAGIGKTWLAREAVRIASRTGGQTLEARCYEQERSLFLQPVLDAIRSALVTMSPALVNEVVADRAGTLAELLPEVGQILRPIGYRPGTPEIERRRSFEAVTATLRELARRQPVLLLLDDLHNAGVSSLELLHFLMRRLSADRLLVIVTLRVEESAEPLAQLAEVADRLDVGPLQDAAVTSLAHLMGAPELADRILKVSRGHPLFVVEALRAFAESPGEAAATPLPESLREAVLSRVHRTGPEVEELLRAAATIGPAFDLSTTSALLDISADEAARRAERALQARLIAEAGSGYEFANDLIQEVLYQTTPVPTRIVRHRRAAALLGDNPEAVGTHASAAEDWPLALEAWLQAGERASLRFSNRDAERMLDQALHAARMADDRVGEARVRLARGRVREALDHYEEAHADHTAAVELAQETGEQAIEMRALRELGGDVLVGTGRQARDTIPFLEAGLSIAERLGDSVQQIDLLSRLAVVWVNLLRFDLAYEHAGRALTLARGLGDDRSLAVALDGLKTAAAYSGDLGTLERVLQELDPILRRQGDLWYLQWAVFESAFPPMARGQWDRAVDRVQEAMAINHRTGHLGWRPMFVAHLGWIERSRGQFGRALALGRQAFDLAEEVGHPWWLAFAGAMLGWTLTELFAYQPAVAHLERARGAAEGVGWESYLVRCLSHLALARWRSGDRSLATQSLERAEAILGQVATPPGGAFLHGGHAYLAAARVRLALGDPGGAEKLVASVLEPSMAAGWQEVAADASLVMGLCREGLGDSADAKQRMAQAVEIAERHGLPRVAWEAHTALAAMSRDAGRSDDAATHASSAQSLVGSMAATIDDEELRGSFVRRASSRAAPR